MYSRPSPILLLFIMTNVCQGGIFSWMFRGYKTAESGDSEYNGRQVTERESGKGNLLVSNSNGIEDGVFAIKVPFEISASDEKFISELSKYTTIELSGLDICNHKVVLSLESSCPGMTEEDISKAAVNLLNCQSAVEGRKVFPCTQNMILHQCTKDMDTTTWNAYHIMSNRVRAVCYQLRNLQFRAKTEMVINKLVSTTQEQIGAMKELEESQSNLKESTSETLDVVNSGYLKLQHQQKELSSAHINIHNYVSSNLRELSKEKKLIAAGQKEVAAITLAIKKKIEEAQSQLLLQEDGQRSIHQKILQDLSQIQESANKVWEQLDKSTQKILDTHDVTAANYEKLMVDLEKINNTVQQLMTVLMRMRQKVEEKFFWISSLLGDTDATVQKIYLFVLHICYCLFGMISASFLQVPYATRVALIVVVPLNALLEIKSEASLPLSSVSVILAVCLLFNVIFISAARIYKWQKNKSIKSVHSNILNLHQPFHGHTASVDVSPAPIKAYLTSSTPCKSTSSIRKSGKNDCTSASMEDDYSSEEEENWKAKMKEHSYLKSSSLSKISEENDLCYSEKNYIGEENEDSCQNIISSVRKRLLNLQQADENKNSSFYSNNNSILNASTRSTHSNTGRLSRSSTPTLNKRNNLTNTISPRNLCSAICKSGLLCKNFATPEGSLCFRHMNGTRESTPF